MLIQQRLSILLTLVILITFSACHKTTKKVRHSPLYKEVMSHYSHDDISKDKTKAALFLFENIDHHCSFINKVSKSSMDTCIASFLKADTLDDGNIHKLANKYINKHYKSSRTKTEVEMDMEQLSATYLINHIDAAYTAWQRTSQVGDISFEDFCNYILPYRAMQEPVEPSFAPQFYEKYALSLDSLIAGVLFEPLMQHIIQTENIYFNRKGFSFPYSFSVKQSYDLRSVKNCDDAAVYFVMLFRALGIPATIDICKRCYRANGHAMLALLWKNEWYSFEVPDGTITKRDLNHCVQSFPKVYRTTYVKRTDHHDITDEFSPTVSIILEKPQNGHAKAAIALFDNDVELKPLLCETTRKGHQLIFDKMGVDCIYALGSIRNRNFHADSIVYVDTIGLLHRLKADYEKRQNLVLTRKYLFDKRHNVRRKEWVDTMNGICIEGSHDLQMNNTDTLFLLSEHTKPHLQHYKLNCTEKYKYIKLSHTDQRVFVAEYMLYDKCNRALKLDSFRYLPSSECFKDLSLGVIHNEPLIITNTAVKWHHKLFDENGLTYSPIGKVGRGVVYVPNGISPSAFAIQARNDENHVVVGDTYELMMWDKGWQSLGVKVAQSHELIYEDVPANALYWLRNLSRGKEEYPFIINDKGEQYWAGQANF